MATNTETVPDGLLESTFGAAVHIVSVDGQFSGSGVLVGKELAGYLYALTAFHVLRDEPIGRVDSFDLAHFPHPIHAFDRRQAEVVAESERLDLALVRLPAAEGFSRRFIPISRESSPPRRAFSLGCSNGEAPTLLSEEILGAARVRRAKQSDSMLMWKTEAPSIQGRSGGALIDQSGNLLGIALGVSGRQGYYCHRDEIVRFLRQHGFEMLLEPVFKEAPAAP